MSRRGEALPGRSLNRLNPSLLKGKLQHSSNTVSTLTVCYRELLEKAKAIIEMKLKELESGLNWDDYTGGAVYGDYGMRNPYGTVWGKQSKHYDDWGGHSFLYRRADSQRE